MLHEDAVMADPGRVRRCGRCGDWIVCDCGMAWLDATGGDCCEDGMHFPVDADAVGWLVALDGSGERTYVGCFAAEAVEAGQVAIRIQRELDRETCRYDAAGGGQPERSYTIVSVERA